MGSDPIKLRLELDGLTYVLESWHKKKIRTATLDELEAELLTPTYMCILGKHNIKWVGKAIDNLRGT